MRAFWGTPSWSPLAYHELHEHAATVLALDAETDRLVLQARLLEGQHLADARLLGNPVLVALGVLGEQVLEQSLDVSRLHAGWLNLS